MDNTINSNKLDEKVKKTLSDYEAPYNPTDWAQMESMLDVAPNHNSLSSSNSPAVLMGVVVVGIIILLYVIFKPTKAPETTTIPVTETVKEEKEIPKVKPVITKSVTVNPDTSSVKVTVEVPEKDSIIPKKEAPATKSTKANTKVVEKKVVSTISNTTTANSTKKMDQAAPVKREMTQVEKSEEFAKREKAAKKEALLKKEKAAKKEAQLKKEKASKKEEKTETKPAASDTVHIDDENDSNRRGTLKSTTEPNLLTKPDTAKVLKEVSKNKKETKSKKDKKTKKDTVTEKKVSPVTAEPAGIKKIPEEMKKDTLKAPK